MVVFPHCKINLGLNIVRKRDDGYHDIETLFFPIPFYDCLEVIHGSSAAGLQFSQSGLPVPGDPAKNLCIKAYQLLKNDFPQLPSAVLHLHKNIPTGAGLGGGSSDGAFTLRLLNARFRLGLSAEELAAYALELGSDAPFFLQDLPCLAGGRGELLEAVKIPLIGYAISLVNPGIQVPTAWAFSRLTPKNPSEQIRDIIRDVDPTMWRNRLTNDFEQAVFESYPEISEIKMKLYEAGAAYASLSGSGSTVYGIFKTEVPKMNWKEGYLIFNTPLFQ